MSTPEDYMSDGPWQAANGETFGAEAPPELEEELADLARRDPYDPENWGEGPWQNEPGRVEFRCLGLPCLIVRNRMGALCGYVGVYADHPWYERHYDNVDANVHGGLTFSNHCTGPICHVPRAEDPGVNVWWVGFDCGHAGDVTPALRAMMPAFLRFRGDDYETYKDIAYVRHEVKCLAVQAKRAATIRGRIGIVLAKLAKVRDLRWKLRNAIRELWRQEEPFRIPGIPEDVEFRMHASARRFRSGD